MAAQDLAPNIGTNSTGPKKVKTDALEVEQMPIGDLISADRYLAAKAARATPTRGIMFSKLIPAAGNPDQQGTSSGASQFDSPGDGA
jgi:hypothetical protein